MFILLEYLIAQCQTCFGKQVIQLEQQLEDYLKILPAIYCCSAWSSYSLGAPQGGSKIPTQIKKNGFFKMQPKIVVVLVLGTPEHLESGLILQNWPSAWPQKFETTHYGVKNQNCRRPIEWPIKTCARRALSLWKRFQLNRTYQLGEKSKKPPENTVFQKSSISSGFLDFSPNW